MATISSKIKIKKTDSRYTGHQCFEYVININPNRDHIHWPFNKPDFKIMIAVSEFLLLRDWCIKTWGMSCERDYYLMYQDYNDPDAPQNPTNPHWAWHSEDRQLKIYLASDHELEWFKLKWC